MAMTSAPLLLASRLLQTPGGLDDVSEAVVSRRDLPLSALLVVVGLVLAGLALRSLHNNLTGAVGDASSHPNDGPSALRIGINICNARGVSWPGRLLLLRIARRSGLQNPLPLLAASGTLYHHGRQYAAGLPSVRRRRVLRGVSRLQRELFSEGQPSPPAPDLAAPSTAPPPDRRARPRAESLAA